jgi:YHS domain-containing protein
MKTILGLLVILLAAMAIAMSLPAKQTEPSDAPQVQANCPVSGKTIDENIYTDFSGKRIYFDSEESKQAFLKDTNKYEEAIKNAGAPLNSKPPRKPQKSQKDCAT